MFEFFVEAAVALTVAVVLGKIIETKFDRWLDNVERERQARKPRS